MTSGYQWPATTSGGRAVQEMEEDNQQLSAAQLNLSAPDHSRNGADDEDDIKNDMAREGSKKVQGVP